MCDLEFLSGVFLRLKLVSAGSAGGGPGLAWHGPSFVPSSGLSPSSLRGNRTRGLPQVSLPLPTALLSIWQLLRAFWCVLLTKLPFYQNTFKDSMPGFGACRCETFMLASAGKDSPTGLGNPLTPGFSQVI